MNRRQALGSGAVMAGVGLTTMINPIAAAINEPVWTSKDGTPPPTFDDKESTEKVYKRKLKSLGKVAINLYDISWLGDVYNLYADPKPIFYPNETIIVMKSGEKIHVKLSMQQVLDKFSAQMSRDVENSRFISVERWKS